MARTKTKRERQSALMDRALEQARTKTKTAEVISPRKARELVRIFARDAMESYREMLNRDEIEDMERERDRLLAFFSYHFPGGKSKAQADQLREALRQIVEFQADPHDPLPPHTQIAMRAKQIARKALEGEDI